MNIDMPDDFVHPRPSPDSTTTYFNRILRAAQPACEPYHVLLNRHTAKAILTTGQAGYTVILQYEPQLCMISMVLELGRIPMPVRPRFFTIPYARAGGRLTTVTINGEDGTAWLRTASLLCPGCREPRPVVRSLIGDLQRCVDGQVWLC